VSSQSPVVGLRHEVHCWVVCVYTEARTVLRAVVTDLFCNCWCLEIPPDNRIRQVPRCAYNRAQNFILEAFWGFNVWSGSRTPQLWSVGPDWFEYCFVYSGIQPNTSQYHWTFRNELIFSLLNTEHWYCTWMTKVCIKKNLRPIAHTWHKMIIKIYRSGLNNFGVWGEIQEHVVRFDVFTAVTMKNAVFLDIRIQFVPHRRHITSPLVSPAS
jgi:hypothetical protein